MDFLKVCVILEEGEFMKAVVFDFDGTLTKNRKGSNCWFEIWKYIDDLEYDGVLFNKYKNKEIDSLQWLDLIFKRFKEKGVKREYLQNIAKSIEILPGTHETLKKLYENDVKIFILSGGVRQIIEEILKREKIDGFITAIETYDLFFNENGELVGYDRPNVHSLESKNEYIEVIKQRYNLSGNEILFVGNGSNDETVYLSGAKTLCINPDDTDMSNRKIWNFGIENCENLMQILEYCGIKQKINSSKSQI